MPRVVTGRTLLPRWQQSPGETRGARERHGSPVWVTPLGMEEGRAGGEGEPWGARAHWSWGSGGRRVRKRPWGVGGAHSGGAPAGDSWVSHEAEGPGDI